jgi:hypothetical protein
LRCSDGALLRISADDRNELWRGDLGPPLVTVVSTKLETDIGQQSGNTQLILSSAAAEVQQIV